MNWRLAIAFCLAAISTNAAPNEAAIGELDGPGIIQRLRAARPPGNSTNSGTLKVFKKKKLTFEIPVRFEVTATEGLWRSIYQNSSANVTKPATRLTVTHHSGTNYYELGTLAADDNCCPTNRPLSGNQTMIPFADSDFWVADLGLEFLQWPKQELLKKDRAGGHEFAVGGRACYVLESTNLDPGTNGYTKVITWLDIESFGASAQPAIVKAEAFDARGKLKAFTPKELEKVDGQYQVQKMEIRNLRTDSRTTIEFNFDSNKP